MEAGCRVGKSDVPCCQLVSHALDSNVKYILVVPYLGIRLLVVLEVEV
jgi:hypothetical protein